MINRARNTWSDQWCDKGEINIPFNNGVITEAWTIYKDPYVLPFTKNLSFGMWNDDVKNLQRALKTENCFPFNCTGFFGILTFNAVKKFQTQNNIQSTGFFGPLSIACMNKIFQ